MALVYSKANKHYTESHYNDPYYLFFRRALQRNKKLDIDYIEHMGRGIDPSSLHKDYDVVLIPSIDTATLLALSGIENSSIPVIVKSGDPHTTKMHNVLLRHKELKIDYYFDLYAPSSFYKYYPKHFKYETVVFGLEPSLYSNLRPYDERVHDRIAISGVMDKPDLKHKLYYRVFLRRIPEFSSWHHYKLRTKCNSLPYVIHTRDVWPDQGTEELPEVLSIFRAAIAAATTFPTMKYMETPASGCLTFMEITEQNDGLHLGYKDGKTAIFLNDDNYKTKLKDFIDNPHDPKWKRIAQAGQKYTLEHLSNDNATDSLVNLMRKAIGE